MNGLGLRHVRDEVWERELPAGAVESVHASPLTRAIIRRFVEIDLVCRHQIRARRRCPPSKSLALLGPMPSGPSFIC